MDQVTKVLDVEGTIEVIDSVEVIKVAANAQVASLAAAVANTCHDVAHVEVDNEDTATLASTWLSRIDQSLATVAELFDDSVASAFKLHRALTSKRNTYLKPLKAAKDTLSSKLGAYHAEKERQAVATREAARLEAVKDAEEERIKSAEVLEKMGRAEDADAIIGAPINVAPVVAASKPTLPPGQSVRYTPKYEVFDPSLLPPQYTMPDKVKIGGTVRALRERTNIPGVRVWMVESVITRRPPGQGGY